MYKAIPARAFGGENSFKAGVLKKLRRFIGLARKITSSFSAIVVHAACPCSISSSARKRKEMPFNWFCCTFHPASLSLLGTLIIFYFSPTYDYHLRDLAVCTALLCIISHLPNSCLVSPFTRLRFSSFPTEFRTARNGMSCRLSHPQPHDQSTSSNTQAIYIALGFVSPSRAG